MPDLEFMRKQLETNPGSLFNQMHLERGICRADHVFIKKVNPSLQNCFYCNDKLENN